MDASGIVDTLPLPGPLILWHADSPPRAQGSGRVVIVAGDAVS